MILAAWVALNAAPAHAETVFRCMADGRVAYSDAPCAVGAARQVALPTIPALDVQTRAQAGLPSASGRAPLVASNDASACAACNDDCGLVKVRVPATLTIVRPKGAV